MKYFQRPKQEREKQKCDTNKCGKNTAIPWNCVLFSSKNGNNLVHTPDTTCADHPPALFLIHDEQLMMQLNSSFISITPPSSSHNSTGIFCAIFASTIIPSACTISPTSMGKKSKNPSKKSNKSNPNANVALNSIQELQSGINSMSMNDAFAAVKMATNSINEMKAEQERAAANLKLARAEVERSKVDKSNNDLYADVNFWEKRYKDEANNNSNSKAQTTDIYEWYLDFEELQTLLLPDITRARKLSAGQDEAEVLVAGCGNSSMCEDLYHAGISNICGMDYSQSVIDVMNRRLNTPALTALKTKGKVRYLQADGTKMPQTMTSSCSAVVDKGTLDAITSGGVAEEESRGKEGSADVTGVGTSAALAYMHEMWRLLQPHGVFVIISTIPPDLFHLVGSSIVPALAKEASKKGKQGDVRTGPGYRIHAFTKEGGNVFYYALFKSPTKLAGNTCGSSGKSEFCQFLILYMLLSFCFLFCMWLPK